MGTHIYPQVKHAILTTLLRRRRSMTQRPSRICRGCSFCFRSFYFFGDTRAIMYINTLILLLYKCSQVVHVLWRHTPAATCVCILHMCPHATYVSSRYICVLRLHMRPLTICVLRLHMCGQVSCVSHVQILLGSMPQYFYKTQQNTCSRLRA